MSFIEEKGNLFDLDNSWCFAHCVGSDFIMGAGIAVLFRKKFGNDEFLLENSKGVDTALLLEHKQSGYNIFYLITKKYSKYTKPNYDNIRECLKDMFLQAKNKGIYKIAMPRIGCGMDGLKWDIVKQIIMELKPNNISICIKFL